MKKYRLPFALVLSLAPLAGCASTVDEDPNTAATPRELSRTDAIASARQDASRSYGNDWGAAPVAQYRGGYWVIELHARSGYTLRYAISARDGSIRERNMVQ